MDKEQHIPFRFVKIETKEFASIAENFNTSIDEISVHAMSQFGFEGEDKSISFVLDINLLQENLPFVILKVIGVFQVEPASWDTEIESEHAFTFPKGLLQHLLILLVGTARGIMHARLDDARFKGFVLPTINVTEMIQNDFVIEKNK